MTRPLAWGGGRACDLLDICNPSGSWHRRNSLQCLPYRHKTGLPGVWPGGRPATCFVLVGCWKTNTVHRKKQQSTHDTRQRMAWPLHLPKPITNNTAHRKPKASSLSKGRAANQALNTPLCSGTARCCELCCCVLHCAIARRRSARDPAPRGLPARIALATPSPATYHPRHRAQHPPTNTNTSDHDHTGGPAQPLNY
jgi:hypothetical protein